MPKQGVSCPDTALPVGYVRTFLLSPFVCVAVSLSHSFGRLPFSKLPQFEPFSLSFLLLVLECGCVCLYFKLVTYKVIVYYSTVKVSIMLHGSHKVLFSQTVSCVCWENSWQNPSAFCDLTQTFKMTKGSRAQLRLNANSLYLEQFSAILDETEMVQFEIPVPLGDIQSFKQKLTICLNQVSSTFLQLRATSWVKYKHWIFLLCSYDLLLMLKLSGGPTMQNKMKTCL